MVRSREYPDGFPWLIGYHLKRAEEGNRIKDTVLGACQMAQASGVPWLIYGPEQCIRHEVKGTPASIWEDPKAKPLAEADECVSGALHMCVFGWTAAGPTRILTSGVRLGYPAKPGKVL